MRRIRKRTFLPRGIIGRHRSEHPRCLPERGNSFVSCHDCRPDAGPFQRSAYVGSCEDQPDDGCSDQLDKTARTIRLATASDDPWLRSCIKGPCITASLSSLPQVASPLAARLTLRLCLSCPSLNAPSPTGTTPAPFAQLSPHDGHLIVAFPRERRYRSLQWAWHRIWQCGVAQAMPRVINCE